jgi:hypothetical protein
MLWCSQAKMARALSVAEGKGAQRTCARCVTGSCCGRVAVGCCAARASGWEKSRQVRQDCCAGGDAGVGAGEALAASIWAKVGRELSGMGGGSEGGEGLRAPEPKPLSRADLVRKVDGGGGRRRFGRAGEGSSGRTTAGELAGLDGSRGGNEGLGAGAGAGAGGSVMRRAGRDGVLLAGAVASFAFASSSRRVGGSGGSLA